MDPDLKPTDLIGIGIIYSLRTTCIYLLSLKLMGQSVLELSVTQGVGDWHDLWPTNLNINRGHLLIKDNLPTKFEAYGAKRSRVINCTRWSRLAWPLTLTFCSGIPTYRPTDICKAIWPPSFQRGGGVHKNWHCTGYEVIDTFTNMVPHLRDYALLQLAMPSL